MSFRITYAQILRMVRATLLDTSVARDIVRKAGIIIGDEEGVEPGSSPLVARFGFRDDYEDTLYVPYGEQTIVPYKGDKLLPVGATHLVKTPDELGVEIELGGYYRVHASMFVVLLETDIPWVTQILACARDADFNLLRYVVLDELYFASEPRDTPDPFTGAWDGTNSPYMHGQNVIIANAGEVLTFDLLVSFLGDPTTSEFYMDGTARIGVNYTLYRQWIELLSPRPPNSIWSGRWCAFARSTLLDGQIFAWGENFAGQLGNGASSYGVARPVPDLDESTVVAMAGGYNHTLALLNDGTVWATGDNSHGKLGDGTTDSRETFAVVPGLSDVVAIACGLDHSLALTQDGNVYEWGRRPAPSTFEEDRLSPTLISEVSNAVDIAGGEQFSIAVISDGTLMAWGDNALGQLGSEVDTLSEPALPATIEGISDVKKVRAGDTFAVALTEGGQLWAWGSNSSGETGYGPLGVGDPDHHSVPNPLVAPLDEIASFDAAGYHLAAVDRAGQVWALGRGDDGQSGGEYSDVYINARNIPVGEAVDVVSCAYYQTFMVTYSGKVYGVGNFAALTTPDPHIGNTFTPIEILRYEPADASEGSDPPTVPFTTQ